VGLNQSKPSADNIPLLTITQYYLSEYSNQSNTNIVPMASFLLDDSWLIVISLTGIIAMNQVTDTYQSHANHNFSELSNEI
jgi:hypothetical protein